jgi:hypothetical protein
MRPAAFAVIGAGLLSWGLLENKMLLIVAGLLFLPLMPTLVRVGFGMLSREWSLRARAIAHVGNRSGLHVCGRRVRRLAATPPVHFNDFSPIKPLIAVATFALFIASTINIAADLSGMADCAEKLTGLQSRWFVPIFGIAITAASI